jgi:3-isopropylmalate dehydrogenase
MENMDKLHGQAEWIVNMDKLMILPGDGIGPEIMNVTTDILDYIISKKNLPVEHEFAMIGGCSIDKYGTPLTDSVLGKCRQSKAILLGAVGGPKWASTDPAKPRPEDALLKLRKELGLYANLRPIKVYDPLVSASTIKEHVIKGVDILFLRELTGDVYFGKKERIVKDGVVTAYDTMIYRDYEIERAARMAFEIAGSRRKKVTSVEKSNVVESSRLWREITIKVHEDYPDIELIHMYVDNAAMQLVRNPGQFDVIVISNMFGDILSDEAAMIAGSIGLIPSASLRDDFFGLYEPIHGSAPDIAGMGKANPLGTILSMALMFKYSFRQEEIAAMIEQAVNTVLEKGLRTSDIYDPEAGSSRLVNTGEMGKAVIAEIRI